MSNPVIEGFARPEDDQAIDGRTRVRAGRVGAVALAGIISAVSVLGAIEQATQPSDAEQHIGQIIKDPANIPADKRMDLVASNGMGIDAFVDAYAAPGQEGHLSAEIRNEANPDGGLQAGTYTVDSDFVKRPQNNPR